ncbi:MAG: cupin domain-containing protein [Opitutales bacterium]
MDVTLPDREEHLSRARADAFEAFLPGVTGQLMTGAFCGANNLCTAILSLTPIAQKTHHRHAFSEAITPLSGPVVVSVEGRRYRLRPYESIHVPAGVAHCAYSASNGQAASVHVAFAAADPTADTVDTFFPFKDRGLEPAAADVPEFIARNEVIEIYELNEGAKFRDLFASRYGSRGICGGYAEFEPGSSLPCHIHEYDESITIIKGTAICEVAGARYTLSDNDTALVPKGRPHRFLNESAGDMAMVWVYAGDEPERTLKTPGYCIGMGHCPVCEQ